MNEAIETEIRLAWAALDKDHSGALDRKEIEQAMQKMSAGKVIDAAKVDKIWKKIDINGDGSVSAARNFSNSLPGGCGFMAGYSHWERNFVLGSKFVIFVIDGALHFHRL